MRMCVDGASVPCRPSRGAQAGSEPQHDHKHVCGQVQHCRGQCPVSLHCHVQFILFCYTTQVACLSHEVCGLAEWKLPVFQSATHGSRSCAHVT